MIVERFATFDVVITGKFEKIQRIHEAFGSTGIVALMEDNVRARNPTGLVPFKTDEGSPDIFFPVCPAKTRSQREVLTIFDIVEQWLMDIGCGHDFVSYKLVRDNISSLSFAGPVTFGTANGCCETVSLVELTSLEPKRNTAIPYVLGSTFSVLPIAKRCVQDGFCLFRITGMIPGLVAFDNEIVLLTVIDDILFGRRHFEEV